MRDHSSVCHLKYYARPRYATHIGSTFLNVTKDGICNTNASPTCAEAALYNFTLLLRLRLIKVVQPLVVFIFRHCDKIDRVQGDVGKPKLKQISNKRVRALYSSGNDSDGGAM
jgi:hypothetical protein